MLAQMLVRMSELVYFDGVGGCVSYGPPRSRGPIDSLGCGVTYGVMCDVRAVESTCSLWKGGRRHIFAGELLRALVVPMCVCMYVRVCVCVCVRV
jgi:hypothetical protein